MEDDKYLVMVYKTALEREGFEVDIAYDGKGDGRFLRSYFT